MKGKRSGNILIIVGLVLIAAAFSLLLYDSHESSQAGSASEQIVEQLVVSDDQLKEEPYLDPSAEMPVKTIDGNDFIGTLEIPDVNMRLPVMMDWDYAKLKISPCRYSGSYFNDDLVICAHNSAAHFMSLWNIAIGTDVYFINVDGLRLHYVVSNLEDLQAEDISLMTQNNRNSDSTADWDLTLYTCTYNGVQRLAVRCVRVQD